MKDRIPKYAGRVRLLPVANQPNIYDMERADEPLQEGTPLNRNTLLSDQTVLEFGLSQDATPDEAMRFLNARRTEFEQEINDDFSGFEQEINERISNFEQEISIYAKIVMGSYVGTGETSKTLNFEFKPKVLFVYPTVSIASTDDPLPATSVIICLQGSSLGIVKRVPSDNQLRPIGVIWGDTHIELSLSLFASSAIDYGNKSGITYKYIALS